MSANFPKVAVDGTNVPVQWILSHYQTEAFPGGHKFVMEMPFAFIPKKVDNWAKFEASDLPDSKTVRNWFYWMESLIGKWNRAVRSDAPIQSNRRFVLNTIERVEVCGESYVFYGSASPFIQ